MTGIPVSEGGAFIDVAASGLVLAAVIVAAAGVARLWQWIKEGTSE